MNEFGFLYIASGEDYIKEATISAQSLKREMPETPVAIVTDRKIEFECFDDVICISDDGKWRDDFGDHVNHIEKTPYNKTVKIDTDIYFDGSILEVFELLDEFDVAVSQAPLRHSTNRVEIPELEDVPSSFPEYQGGLIGYRDSKEFSNFLRRWKSAYQSTLNAGEVSNQASLRSALYHSDCRIATLSDEYNCLFRMPGSVNGKVKVFHGRLLKISGKGAPKRADVRQAVNTLNSSTELRAFYRSGSKVKLARPNLLVEGVDSIRRNGIHFTLKRAYSRLRNN